MRHLAWQLVVLGKVFGAVPGVSWRLVRDGRDSFFNPATLRSREADLGCEERSSRDLSLLRNFQAGAELAARGWKSHESTWRR